MCLSATKEKSFSSHWCIHIFLGTMLISLILIKPVLEVLCSFTVCNTEYSGVLFLWHGSDSAIQVRLQTRTLSPWSPVLDRESTGLTWSGHLFSLQCVIFTYLSISTLVDTIELTKWVSIIHTTINTFPPSGKSLTMRMLLTSFGLMVLLRICDGRVRNQAPLFISLTVLLCFSI